MHLTGNVPRSNLSGAILTQFTLKIVHIKSIIKSLSVWGKVMFLQESVIPFISDVCVDKGASTYGQGEMWIGCMWSGVWTGGGMDGVDVEGGVDKEVWKGGCVTRGVDRCVVLTGGW